MSLAHKIAHLLVPRQSNNHKAKLLHNQSLVTIAIILLGIPYVFDFFKAVNPSVLGYAAQIPPSTVIALTNAERKAAGLEELKENSTLSKAALAKGTDMLNKGYWAHVAPDGTTPWQFFVNAGYKYRYAGENLARDFTNPGSTVAAWMASPTHKENLLSPKYKEIGVAVVEGNLSGADTTIVVQLFGAPQTAVARVVQPQGAATEEVPVQVAKAALAEPVEELAPQLRSGVSLPQVSSPFTTTKVVSAVVLMALIAIFILDALVVHARGTVRVSGRTFAHVSFLGMVIVVLIIVKAGRIL